MISFRVDMRGLRQGAQELGALPAQIERARKSALKATAWMGMSELRNHVEYGGSGWKPLHPMTLKLRKSKSSPPTPLFFLGRFARYRVDEAGTIADIDFGKSKKGRPGTFDRGVGEMVAQMEAGLRIPTTERMRRWFSVATRPKGRRGKRAIAGKDYFPLRKSTPAIVVPARPVFAPVWKKIQPRLKGYFDEKFRLAIVRYLTGATKT